MENHFHPHEDFGRTDVQREAQRFEARLQEQDSFYVDLTTVEDLFDFYRVHDQQAKALALLDFAIQQYPYNADLLYKKSQVELEQDRVANAYELIQQALDYQPGDPAYLIQKGRLQATMGLVDEALETLNQALLYTDDHSEIQYELGQVCQNDERYQEAIVHYTYAIESGPEYEEALFEIVYCFELLNRQADGCAYLERFLDEQPYSSVAWYNLGILQQKLGRYEQAMDSFDYAIVIQEDFISAYYGKASCLMDLARYEQAIAVLLQSQTHDKNDLVTLLALGECYEHLEDNTRARFYYGRCTELVADLSDAWYGIGSTYEAEQRYLEAIHYYKKAIDCNKECFDAWLGLADCEYLLGNEVSAYEALRNAIHLYAEDIEMWRVWGERLCEDRSPVHALDLLGEALRHNPTSADLVYQYAAYALMAGRSREGLNYLENALMMDYSRHPLLFDFAARLHEFPPVGALIQQYKPLA